MIRLTGGRLNGRQINSPKNKAIRPTTGRVRKSLFAKIHPRLTEARFLDLFAGSGIMGLEALSRGASFVMAVEKKPAHTRLIRENYHTLEIPREQHKILTLDVEHLMAKPRQETELPFDVIYLDPPYGYWAMKKLIANILLHHWLTPDGLILMEQGKRDPELSGTSDLDTPYTIEYKDYSDTVIGFIQPVAPTC